MSRPDTEVLGHHLRRLDDDAFAAFVADLWAARGYETRRDGGRVHAAREGTALTIAAGPVGRDAADADVVVTPRVDPGRERSRDGSARVVDADDLRDALWYALDRETARALCERHLGAPPADLRPPLRRRARERLRAVESPVSPATVAVLLVVLVVLVAAVTVSTLQSAGGGGAPPTAVDDTPDGTPATGPATADAATTDSDDAGTTTAAPDPPDDVPPSVPVPGLDPGGVTDLEALSTAHERALENRSYTLWLDASQPRGGVPGATTVRQDVDVAVAGGRYYLVETRGRDDRARQALLAYHDVDTTGLEADRRQVRSVYHDGTDSFLATDLAGNATYATYRGTSSVPGSIDPYRFAETLVEGALETTRNDVTARVSRGNRTLYRVVGEGQPSFGPAGRVLNYTAVALVAESGLVVEGRVTYAVATVGGGYHVRIAWRYGRLDETRVEPPRWHAEALASNATVVPDDASVEPTRRVRRTRRGR
jgi:hypothetical protein